MCAQISSMKRKYEDAFVGFDNSESVNFYCDEPPLKKARAEEKTNFYVNVKCQNSGRRFIGTFKRIERLKFSEGLESILRRIGDVSITDFAFHNPICSQQAIRVLNATNEIVSRFSVGYACFPTVSSGLKENQSTSYYHEIRSRMLREKCCAVAPCGENHLLIFYVDETELHNIQAILIKKFYYILDLDDTLVRSRLPKLESDQPEDDERIIYVGQHKVFTKILGNVPSFLEWADRLFHIIFVTNSVFPYASSIVRILDSDRKHVLSRVRTMDCEGLKGVLKHRGDLLCFISPMESKNNDIGLDEEEKRKKEELDRRKHGEEDELDKNDNKDGSPDHNNQKKRRRRSLEHVKKQTDSSKKNKKPKSITVPAPPSIQPESQEKKRKSEPKVVAPPPKPRRQSAIHRYVFVKDLENLGMDVDRCIVMDDQKHVWVRNQFNCVPFPVVNDGKGIQMEQTKNETFKKMMELRMRVIVNAVNSQRQMAMNSHQHKFAEQQQLMQQSN